MISEKKVTIGTFRPKLLQEMHKFPSTSNFTYNANFLEDFKQKECEQYEKILPDLIKDWVSHPAKFKVDSNRSLFHIFFGSIVQIHSNDDM
jgi:hypothetical protein